MSTPDETERPDRFEPSRNAEAADSAPAAEEPGGDAEPSADEEERVRRKLGLSPLEWALSGSFAEQRRRGTPLVIPGFGGRPAEGGRTQGTDATGEAGTPETGESGGAPPARQG